MHKPRRETYAYRTLDAAVAQLAVRQHGIVALAQLREVGLSAAAVNRRARAGRLHRIHRGVYALVPAALLSLDGRRLAAVLACGSGAVLSHRDAAAVHRLAQSSNRTRFEVTVPGTSTRRHQGIQVHRARGLTAADITVVDAIPATSVARTLLDLAAVVARDRTDNALHQADVRGVLDLERCDDQLQRNPHHPGARRLREALALYRSDGVDENELERGFVALVRAAGLPAPERQAWLRLDDGGPALRPDFLWRDHRLILETDGRAHHATRRAFESDRRRDQRLVRAGWRVIRVTWRQIVYEPEYVIGLVADLLRADAA